MGLQILLEWWNLLYVIPFGLAFLFLLMQVAGLGDAHHELGHDAHPELGHGPDHDVDHDVDHDADHDVEHDVDHDAPAAHADAVHGDVHGHEHETVPAQSGGLFSWIAGLLGLGKIPLSLALMIFCFSFGFLGFALNVLLEPWLRSPLLFFPLSLAGSSTGSLWITARLAETVSRYLPKISSHGGGPRDLEGRSGSALYAFGADGRGTLRVRDRNGNILQFDAALSPPGAIPADTPLLLIRWDAEKSTFEVERETDETGKLPGAPTP